VSNELLIPCVSKDSIFFYFEFLNKLCYLHSSAIFKIDFDGVKNTSKYLSRVYGLVIHVQMNSNGTILLDFDGSLVYD